MDLSSVNSVSSDISATYTTGNRTSGKSTSSSSSYGKDAAAVYEKSSVSKKDNAALIEKLKADTQNRIDQMRSLVANMISQQGGTLAKADDMWSFLAKGDFTVDAETKAKAQEAISEDGYWGVKQTSERIFDFAMALSGGDDEKMEKMLEAFKKGFSEATKAWGKELPDISSRTYDAVLQKFEDYKNRATETEA